MGIWARNVPDWLTFLYACAKIGAVAVTVKHELQTGGTGVPLRKLRYAYSVYCRRRKGQQLRGNDLTMLPELKTLQAGGHEEQTSLHAQCGVHRSGKIPECIHGKILLLGSNIDDEELINKELVSCHDTVNMQYTSGTTGFPKGVMLYPL